MVNILSNTSYTVKRLPKTNKILPKWRNSAKSGHTVLNCGEWTFTLKPHERVLLNKFTIFTTFGSLEGHLGLFFVITFSSVTLIVTQWFMKMDSNPGTLVYKTTAPNCITTNVLLFLAIVCLYLNYHISLRLRVK